MNKQDAILNGFRSEMEKDAFLAKALAIGAIGAGGYGSYKMIQGKKQKQKRVAAKRRITGTFQPGAGMIAPPRAY